MGLNQRKVTYWTDGGGHVKYIIVHPAINHEDRADVRGKLFRGWQGRGRALSRGEAFGGVREIGRIGMNGWGGIIATGRKARPRDFPERIRYIHYEWFSPLNPTIPTSICGKCVCDGVKDGQHFMPQTPFGCVGNDHERVRFIKERFLQNWTNAPIVYMLRTHSKSYRTPSNTGFCPNYLPKRRMGSLKPGLHRLRLE